MVVGLVSAGYVGFQAWRGPDRANADRSGPPTRLDKVESDVTALQQAVGGLADRQDASERRIGKVEKTIETRLGGPASLPNPSDSDAAASRQGPGVQRMETGTLKEVPVAVAESAGGAPSQVISVKGVSGADAGVADPPPAPPPAAAESGESGPEARVAPNRGPTAGTVSAASAGGGNVQAPMVPTRIIGGQVSTTSKEPEKPVASVRANAQRQARQAADAEVAPAVSAAANDAFSPARNARVQTATGGARPALETGSIAASSWQTSSGSADTNSTAAGTTASKGPAGLEIAATTSLDGARESWGQFRSRDGGVLAGAQPRVMPSADGTRFRLIAGPYRSEAEASEACRELQARGIACRPTGYGGAPL